jgi:hypothetical protein
LNNKNYLITGKIFLIDGKPFFNATIYIHVIDISFLDTYSNILYTHIIKDIDYFKNSTFNIDFTFHIEKVQIKQDKNYSLQIHIDVDNDKKISIGDYINMENYPLINFIKSNNSFVNLKRIK